jgi:DNA-directed RNA polymerase specialized sigma24 family protein
MQHTGQAETTRRRRERNQVLGTDWLCDTDDFLGRDIPEGDSLTVTERILRIHRLLVEQNADNRQALATRELERLQFVFGRLTDAEDAYDALLDTMMTRYADIPQYADSLRAGVPAGLKMREYQLLGSIR